MTKEITLKNERYGSPISLRLSQHLKEYTNIHNRGEAARFTSVGLSTINQVIQMVNSLTKDNERAIVYLLGVAIENCKERPVKDRAALKILNSMKTK
tara:strand:+ start:3923 stop:4213 length:291 start_codon:yes stop_codon:yes gene_type:complete